MYLKCLVPLYSIYLLQLCDCAKILAVFPMPVPSHYILGNALLRGLAEAGHDVTMVSPFSEKYPPKKGSWRDVILTGFKMEEKKEFKLASFDAENISPLVYMAMLPFQIVPATANILNQTNVQTLMKSGETFDVVIAGHFMNDAVKAFAAHFNAHLIVFSSVGTHPTINHFVGNPSLPSYVPEVFSNFPSKMSFIQRLKNTIYTITQSSITHLYSYPAHNKLVQQYFPNVDLELYNVSLVLLNSHVGIANPLPYVPCMIDIGGFHITSPRKLPDDLQTFLDGANEGVIYMSMGSNVKSKDFPVEKRDALLRTFSKLKQKVLWKWEDDMLPDQPSNVKTGKWLPQQDILAHKNVKLFITHGGLLSTIETVHYGIPIIAIPIFGDQKMNAYSAEMAGYGLVIPFAELSEERLSSLVEEVLTNPKYTNEVQRRSRILRDRQMKPLDNAIYWVEYVIRHNGAKHLRVAYLDLAWYQYYLLDVFAFILLVIVGIYFVLKHVLKRILLRRKQNKLKIF